MKYSGFISEINAVSFGTHIRKFCFSTYTHAKFVDEEEIAQLSWFIPRIGYLINATKH